MKCGKTYCRCGRTEKWSSRNREIWRKCTEANEFKNVPKFMKKMCQSCLKYTRCALSFSVVSKAIYIQGKCVVSNVAAHADFKSFKENWNHCLGHITTESTSAGISSIWWHSFEGFKQVLKLFTHCSGKGGSHIHLMANWGWFIIHSSDDRHVPSFYDLLSFFDNEWFILLSLIKFIVETSSFLQWYSSFPTF